MTQQAQTASPAVQTVFERVEKKYLLTPAQYEAFWPVITRYMTPDAYGRHTISNLYYDTADYRIIRTSLQKPVYKEKLRLRSYGVPNENSTVFVEIKKKFKGIVYKRREAMTLAEADQYFASGAHPAGLENSQILREVDAFLAFWQPEARVFLAYDRVALAGNENAELRVTFDTNIRWRTADLLLQAGNAGAPLPLPLAGAVLMEVKIPGAMPLWMARAFSLLGVWPVSISKYGSCYENCLLPRLAAQQDSALFPMAAWKQRTEKIQPNNTLQGGMPCA